MSKFFSVKLYWEGLKKSRLMGITFTAITTVLTALVPLVQLLTPRYYEPGYTPPTTIIDPRNFAIPLLMLLLVAPILTFAMFSYLNKRNESDFYHSIPFTRPCVYFSFLTAALTWTVIALTLSLLITSLIWLAVPYTAYSISTPFVLFFTYLLASLLLSGFMAVAMTITGTAISNLLIFALLFGFVRISGAIFILCLESQYPILVTALTPARLLSADYSMPLSLLMSTINGSGQAFSNVGLWIYTAVIALALIAVGCILYTVRRSETAGQSAPNRILQHIYRCAITLPMAFLTAFYIISEGFEMEVILVLVVITLLIYYVYEIITTKKLKNCISASIFLPVVLAGGIVFGIAIPLAGNAAVNYTPDADEIESISIYEEADPYTESTYEDIRTGSVEISSPEALRMIADELAQMKETVLASDAKHYLYPQRYAQSYEISDGYYYDDYYKEEVSYRRITLKITDQLGISRGRTFCFTEEEYLRLLTLFTETEEYENALLALPTEDEILHLYVGGYSSYKGEFDPEAVWKCFVTEYNALTKAEKVEYKSQERYSEYSVEVYGTVGIESFYRYYDIDYDRFPATCAMVAACKNAAYEEDYESLLLSIRENTAQQLYMDCSTSDDNYFSIQGQAHTYLEAIEFLDSCQTPVTGDAVMLTMRINSDYHYAQRHYILSQTDYLTFCEMAGVQLEKGEVKEPVVIE